MEVGVVGIGVVFVDWVQMGKGEEEYFLLCVAEEVVLFVDG